MPHACGPFLLRAGRSLRSQCTSDLYSLLLCSTMPTAPMPRPRARCMSAATMVTLHVNGVRYLEKAPLPYWLVAAAYRNLWRERIRVAPAHGIVGDVAGMARVRVGTARLR